MISHVDDLLWIGDEPMQQVMREVQKGSALGRSRTARSSPTVRAHYDKTVKGF